jgi:hypothetical protein
MVVEEFTSHGNIDVLTEVSQTANAGKQIDKELTIHELVGPEMIRDLGSSHFFACS